MKLSFLLSTLVCLTPVLAGQGQERALHDNSIDLSNGAVLGVEILTPGVISSVELEGNSTTTEVTVKGKAHVGKGVPDVAYIYIIDSSGSTEDYDGECGSTLECVQAFYEELHNETMANGSAELVAVIDFDDYARVVAGFQAPTNTQVLDSIHGMTSSGGTACSHALEAATLLVHQQKVASTTVVIFAGDGMCNGGNEAGGVVSEDVTGAADLLGDTGAIVHSIAVGDMVDCSINNDLVSIPRNGGDCFSIPEPKALPSIIDDLIGTELKSLEIEVDGRRYRGLGRVETGGVGLPQEGAISIDFETEVRGLALGTHDICIRATGEDSLGGVSEVVDCHTVEVRAATTAAPSIVGTETHVESMFGGEIEAGYSGWGKSHWTILAVVVASAGVLAVALHKIFRSSSGRAIDQAMDEERTDVIVDHMEVHQGVPVEYPQNVI